MSMSNKTEEFFKKFKDKHSDKYRYVSGEYINGKSIFVFNCSLHGDISKPAVNWLSGGCEKCSYIERALRKRNDDFSVMERLCETYPDDKFKFRIIDNVSSKGIVEMTCAKHGTTRHMIQTALNGSLGCRKCRGERISIDQMDNKDSFINKAILVHGDKYTYGKFEYHGSKIKSIFTCNIHGDFETRPNDLLMGHGCPVCSKTSSNGELEIISYIKSIYNGKIDLRSRKVISPYEVDIYIPEFNLAIEYNGIAFHHSSDTEDRFYKNTFKDKSYHYKKWILAKDKGVTLISIPDFYWNDLHKREIIKSKISHYLMLDVKIHARKCNIAPVRNSIAKEFYSSTHIEGKGFNYKNEKSFGLFYNNEMIMCVTVGDIYDQASKSFKSKVNRVSTKLGYTVVGGLSKILNFLSKDYKDLKYQFTIGFGGSTSSSFNCKYLGPRYFWVSPSTLKYYHRNQCQKHLLEKNFGKPLLDKETETEYMHRLGYLKYYDPGICEITF